MTEPLDNRLATALGDVLPELASDPRVSAVRVSGARLDSRRVERGELFMAVPGAASDGRRFVDEALRRGAGAIVLEGEPGVT